MLSCTADNHGFFKYVIEQRDKLNDLFERHPSFILYGEWLVPHALKTYREDAWRQFYLFDIYNTFTESYMHYDLVCDIAEQFNIKHIPPLFVANNVTYGALLKSLETNTFLIKDGEGHGEGVVIKNYRYRNRFGRACHAKIVSNVFKEQHAKANPLANKEMKAMTEQDFVDFAVDLPLVDKTYAKIVNENEGWNSKYIPQLLGRVQHDVITEEIWTFIKKQKFPTINFKTLNTLIIMKIKQLKPELF